MTTYPKANKAAQWFADIPALRGATIDPNCGVLHTTEGVGWPSYQGGATAPTYTVLPVIETRKLMWRAHFPDEMSARALRNESGGVNTNTANCIQVELIGTCDDSKRQSWNGLTAGKSYIYWPEAPDWCRDQLAEFIAWCNQTHGIRIDGPEHWLAYGVDERRPGITPASYGAHPYRMTDAQWRGFFGWCGHQHVPENSHGDPGRFPWADVAARAEALVEPVSPPVDRTLTVGTANVLWKLKPDVAARMLNHVHGLCPDIMLWQEAAHHRKALRHHAYDCYQAGPSAALAGRAITWRKDDLELDDAGVRLLNRAGFTGHPPERWATWVILRDKRTGLRVAAVSVHLIARVETKGRARRLPRLKLYASSMRELRRLVRGLRERADVVFVGGDFNVNARLDKGQTPYFPRAALRGLLMSAWDEVGLPRGGTHGKRRVIDYVFRTTPKRGLAVKAQRAHVVDGQPSDHKPVLVRYQLTLKEGNRG